MKKMYISSLLIIIPLFITSCGSKTSTPLYENHQTLEYVNNRTIENRGLQQIQELMNTIHLALNHSLQQDPSGINGMKMCATSVADIKEQYNTLLPQDSTVRRTALKYRNPNNQPDTIDRKVMQKMINEMNTNLPVVVELSDHYRIYKPLLTKRSCLTCHGDPANFSPKLIKVIQENYPNDLAIHFQENAFRGVVVSEIQK